MRNRERGIFFNIDWVSVLLYVLLVFIGWVNIYAAVYNEDHQSIMDVSQKYGKQLIWIGTAFVLAMVILIIDAEFYVAFAYPIFGFGILLLIIVLLFGTEVAGSKSWIRFGEFQIQPAEFAKFMTGLALAKYLSSINRKMENLETKVMSILIIALPALLIKLENETGVALVFAAFVFVLYREGLSGNYMLIGLLVGILFLLALLVSPKVLSFIMLVIAIVVFFAGKRTVKRTVVIFLVYAFASGAVIGTAYAFDKLQPHQKTRINVFLGKEVDLKGKGYNVYQAKIAIGSGGFTGKGFLQGTQTKYEFVPEQETDFIFCTVGEEWGFLGSALVIILQLGLIIRLVFMAERQRSLFSRIYGYGVACILFFHIAVNIGMTIGLAPVIGIPLPFFSYGGSSLWAFTILLFIFIKLDANRLLVFR